MENCLRYFSKLTFSTRRLKCRLFLGTAIFFRVDFVMLGLDGSMADAIVNGIPGINFYHGKIVKEAFRFISLPWRTMDKNDFEILIVQRNNNFIIQPVEKYCAHKNSTRSVYLFTSSHMWTVTQTHKVDYLFLADHGFHAWVPHKIWLIKEHVTRLYKIHLIFSSRFLEQVKYED